jgi:hypothetical protein
MNIKMKTLSLLLFVSCNTNTAPTISKECVIIDEGSRVCVSAEAYNQDTLGTSVNCLTTVSPTIALLDPEFACNSEFIREKKSTIGYVVPFANIGREPQFIWTSVDSIHVTLSSACGLE